MKLPKRLAEVVQVSQELAGGLSTTLANFTPWFNVNRLDLFPAFTDHGSQHIDDVLRSAASLITDSAWDQLTPEDATCLVLGVLLHDCAMHLSKESFITLIGSSQSPPDLLKKYYPRDEPWTQLWRRFMGEARRFDERKLKSIFGDTVPVRSLPPNSIDWTERDCLLAGEFVRRHHTRMAMEFAITGVPGHSPSHRLNAVTGLPEHVVLMGGLIGRSHGTSIRDASDRIPQHGLREYRRIHVPYLMAVLRISDYLQVQQERAPAQLLALRGLRSPLSRAAWGDHEAVKNIHMHHDDPEAIFVHAEPKSVATYLRLKDLLKDIQRELDDSWAHLGEVYGRHTPMNQLAMGVRRIRSNIDDPAAFVKESGVNYVPRRFRFETATSELLKLLVGPLYGNDASIGVRELLQNALDAVREAHDVLAKGGATPASGLSGQEEPHVKVSIDADGHGAIWLEVMDRGIGMTEDVVHDYFLTAGASFRNSDEWRQLHESISGQSRIARSGRFGIGVLAAFLIGDRVQVSTRSLQAVTGLHFEASIQDTEIEIDHVDCPVGTVIRIRIRDYTTFRQQCAICPVKYGLAWPRVQWTSHDHLWSERRISLPKPSQDPLPDDWKRLAVTGYQDFVWTYGRRHDTYDSDLRVAGGHELWCNGIFVGDALRSGTLSSDAGFSIRCPTISLFDYDGRLPLNLQRSGLTEARPDYAQPLNDQVCGILVASVVESWRAWIDAKDSSDSPWAIESGSLFRRVVGTYGRPFDESVGYCEGFWHNGRWGLSHPALLRSSGAQYLLMATAEDLKLLFPLLRDGDHETVALLASKSASIPNRSRVESWVQMSVFGRNLCLVSRSADYSVMSVLSKDKFEAVRHYFAKRDLKKIAISSDSGMVTLARGILEGSGGAEIVARLRRSGLTFALIEVGSIKPNVESPEIGDTGSGLLSHWRRATGDGFVRSSER